jgi:hypothetical protein
LLSGRRRVTLALGGTIDVGFLGAVFVFYILQGVPLLAAPMRLRDSSARETRPRSRCERALPW